MRTLIAGIVGGVILFIWGMLSWAVFSVHTSSVRALPNEDAVVGALQSSTLSKGVYFIPAMPQKGAAADAVKAYEEKFQRGPVGMVFYDPAGMNLMMPGQMLIGFLLTILSAAMVAWFLARSTAFAASYLARVAYCGMFGIFIVLASNLVEWNWLNEPNDWAYALVVDSIVGWILAGLGIAAIVKSKPAVPQAS